MSIVLTDVAAPLPRRISARLGVVDWTSRRWRRWAFDVAAVALLYYGAAKLGYELEFAGPVAAIVWLPVGVGDRLPLTSAGSFLARRADRRPAREQLRHAAGRLRARADVREHARGARRGRARPPAACRRGARRSRRSSGVVGLVFALALGTAISATIGPLSLVLARGCRSTFPADDLPGRGGSAISAARSWSCRSPSPGIRPPKQFADAGARVEARCSRSPSSAALTEIAYTHERAARLSRLPGARLGSVRFGPRGATLAVAVSRGRHRLVR